MKLRVPRRFTDASLDKVDPKQFKPVFAYAKKIRENVISGRGLLFSGPPGVGKTYALVALTREAVGFYEEQRIRFDYEFVTAPDMFDQMPAVMGMDAGEHMQDKRRGRLWSETFCRVPWLVINDLGKEYRGGALGEQVAYKLGRVLRERSERRLPTFVTTNLTIEKGAANGLASVYGESITSLLSEMVRIYSVNGEDRRKSRDDEE